MSGMFTDFWRIVKPAPSKNTYVTSSPEAAKLYSNFSWYSKVMKGASGRFSKYSQYKNMDSDVFVARALDTIAEEMTQINSHTNLPFEIEYQTESTESVPENVTMTIRAALRHWSEIQDFNTIHFDIARTTIKYGDCFFRKLSDFRKWQYVDPLDIIGISINEHGKPEHYHIRVGEKNRQGAFGDVVMLPAAGVIHFSLTSSMGESGPFGEGVLAPCVKAFRHLSLLEDSVIIYRIVRAPERRVFFIDTGNMPPHRVRAYLESVKTEMKEKRIPNESGGTDKIDSAYNPIGQTQDYFFAQSADGRGSRVETLPGGECLSLDTKIKLLDGRDVALSDLIVEYKSGKENWVYSCDPVTGKFAPGKITWAGVTRKNTQVIKFTLDNGETFTVTPDHKFPIKNVGFVEAQDLEVGQSMMPIYLKRDTIRPGYDLDYTKLLENDTGKWIPVHRLVAKYLKGTQYENKFYHQSHDEDLNTIHHLNFNRFDNSPSNLAWMGKSDHWKYHSSMQWYPTLKAAERMKWLKENDHDKYKKIIDSQVESRKRWRDSLTLEQKLALNKKLQESVKKYHATIDDHQREIHAKASRDNLMKGTKVLQEKLKDPEFNKFFGDRIKAGHEISQSEHPEIWKARGEKIGAFSKALWQDEEYRSHGLVRATKNFNDYIKRDPEGYKLRNENVSKARMYMYDEVIANKVIMLIRDSGKLYIQRDELLEKMNSDNELLTHFRELNKKQFSSVGNGMFSNNSLIGIAKFKGFIGWKELRKSVSYQNHKITKIEWLDEKVDTGTITVDGLEELHDNHTFALSCGIYTKNSIGVIDDLQYFQNKFLQGLRIPSSYMRGGADGGIAISDGKVGVAYIEELRFANYVKRLQSKLDDTFDSHFKAYLKSANLNIDPQLFKLKQTDPQNFSKYKQAEVDEKMISNYGSVKDVTVLAERFKLTKYLGLTEDEIQENEALRKKEVGIPDDGIDETLTVTRMLYDLKWIESRPEPKVSDDYDNHEKATENPDDEESDEKPAEKSDKPDDEESEGSGGEKSEPKSTGEKGESAPPKEEPAGDDIGDKIDDKI